MKSVKRLLAFLRGFFPSQLPTGITGFDQWASSIFDTYNIPSNSTYRHALASMIMHLGPTTHRKSKWFFVASIRKAQANQIAYEVIEQVKADDRKKAEEAAAQAKLEAETTQPSNNVAH